VDALPPVVDHGSSHCKRMAQKLVEVAQSGNFEVVESWISKWFETLVQQTCTESNSFVYSSFVRALDAMKKSIMEEVAPPCSRKRFIIPSSVSYCSSSRF
jgi:hypothetical protein